jgi:hypothetical protein
MVDAVVERAYLRPVPSRPPGPVEPRLAARHVASRLPALEPLPRDALALVTLAGRSRAEAAGRLAVDPEQLAVALARGRKELRRSLAPLPGSGWCERAERLMSDRLDGALDDVGSARLDVHLKNCPRCVEHERRLVQAIDGLVAGLATEPAPAAAEPTPAAAPLRLAEARAQRSPRAPIAVRPFGVPVALPREMIEADERIALPGPLAAFAIAVLLLLSAWAAVGFQL